MGRPLRNVDTRRLFALAIAGALLASARPAAAQPADAPAQTVATSPNGQVAVRLDVDAAGAARLAITSGGKPLLAVPQLGLDIAELPELSRGLKVVGAERESIDETYELAVPTKTRRPRNHCEQVVVRLRTDVPDAGGRELHVVLRAYDDGVAFRYVVPAQGTAREVQVKSERTRFEFADDRLAYALPLRNFTSPYENYYDTKRLSALGAGELFGVPLLTHAEGGPAVAITEADLTDFAGMYLQPMKPATPDAKPQLAATLSPLPRQRDVAVRAALPLRSPWRVVMIGATPGALIESTLVLNLNEPSKIADPSWIKPGKVAFPWWNGYVVPADAGFVGDVNTPTLKYYIDFCAENGIEFASIDGNVEAWYGGPNTPWLGADVTKPRPDLDIDAVMAYAKSKNVRVRLWMHWAGLQARLDEALATYARWGIDGIMIDFMDRDDQEMVDFYHEVARKCAALKLTVNYHGAYKPTGMERTWPNVMNYEAALNLEYNKWTMEQSRGSPADHELFFPFTRMLAGPIDYHSGGMRSVHPGDFDFQYIAPQVIGTRARQLGRYVVYENPLPMLSDDPASYRAAAGFDFLKAVPTTWDETRVLAGEVGQVVAIARRHGETWWIGAMAGNAARTVKVRLDCLGKAGEAFDVKRYDDDATPGAPATAVRISDAQVKAGDEYTIEMIPAGGHAARFTRRAAGTR